MKTNRNIPVVLAIIILTFSVPACGVGAPATPTPTVPPATDTPLPTPTKTVRPTETPKQTATPDMAATQKVDDFYAVLQSFEEKGYLESTDGEIFELESFNEEWAQIGWYQWINILSEGV